MGHCRKREKRKEGFFFVFYIVNMIVQIYIYIGCVIMTQSLHKKLFELHIIFWHFHRNVSSVGPWNVWPIGLSALSLSALCTLQILNPSPGNVLHCRSRLLLSNVKKGNLTWYNSLQPTEGALHYLIVSLNRMQC